MKNPSLLGNTNYQKIFNATHRSVGQSNHMLIKLEIATMSLAYLMILMNFHCAKNLLSHKTGIFRSAIMKRDVELPLTVPDEVQNVY